MSDAVGEQLAWEKRVRPRAAVAAALGAIGVVAVRWHPFVEVYPLDAPGVVQQIVLSKGPASGLLGGLEAALEPGSVDDRPSSHIERFAYLRDHLTDVVLIALACALTLFVVGLALAALYGATKARRPELSRRIYYAITIGATMIAVGNLIFLGGVVGYADEIIRLKPTVGEFSEIKPGVARDIGQTMAILGRFALAVGWIALALNAMRVGLLTRFMGALGVIGAGLLIIPLGPMPIVMMFWLLMLSMLFAAKWPGQMPPAWETGTAVPWPSPAERSRPAPPPPRERKAKAPKPVPPKPRNTDGEGAAHPSSKKRKRKRRG